MKRDTQFLKDLSVSGSEYDVQKIYTNELNFYYPDVKINRPYNCDGLIEKGQLKLILELKYNENFLNKSMQCKVIIQSLYYIKKFGIDELKIPNILLIGDKNQLFVISNHIIDKYIDEDIDWSIAPSKAGLKNPKLILKMVKDDEIIPHLFDINDDFNFKQVINYIDFLVHDLKNYVPITATNISSIYDYFIIRVIKNYKKYNTNELVSIFITLMVNPQSNYLHPLKKNYLVLQNGKEIYIDKDQFLSFFDYFQRDYSPKEKEKFTEISDRLIEDTSRRRKGEFYTPTIWVNEAYSMIDKAIGIDWKEKYVVWDSAWGTGNLTRDYNFKELYCSTLYESDISIGNKYNKNKNTVKFQYDFLNDGIEFLEGKALVDSSIKLPEDLLKAFKNNNPILILINPPYASAGNMKTDGSNKKGIIATKVNKLMKSYHMGPCSQQLYAQFIFRILLMKILYKHSDIVLCLFSTSLFLTGSSFKKFRTLFLDHFRYEDGMLFQSSNFNDVSKFWGISFSIWSSGQTLDKNNFIHILKQIPINSSYAVNQIVSMGSKKIYNLDQKKSFSDWIKEDVRALKTYEAPLLSSALNLKETGYGKLAKDALGFYVNSGNSIYDNNGDVFLVSSCSSRGHGISILPSNFTRVTANFTARKVMTGKYSTWINNKDEYLPPDTSHPQYIEWCNDAIIYSLFNTSSNQSALRHIKYKYKIYDIPNEFFFMSNSDLQNLDNKYSNDEIYYDAKSFNKERYVYRYINQITLSYEARKVLTKAINLTEKSFEYRSLVSEDHPEYQLNSWDAGWYQIKKILKIYYRNDLEDFNELYNTLGLKLRSMLYNLRMLL
jgi:hypothetical protein